MREIITLQLGQLSNYAATHFWNAQESYFTYTSEDQSLVDHNVHWRPGLAADGSETFLPRTVIYDLKGGFGSLRKINALYEPEAEGSSDALWSGQAIVHKQPPVPSSAYQQSLDAGSPPPRLTSSAVRYWSDFSRVYYHPRSLVQLYDYELNSVTMPFERFAMGPELFASLDRDHDIVDRDWRPFAEECDRLQGIQVMTSVDDAWAGFAASYVEALRDEYPKTCIWVWGLAGPTLDDAPRGKRQLRLVNTAHAVDRLTAHATTLVPLALPEGGDFPAGLAVDRRSPWHASAALGAAIETATLPSRLAGESSASLDYLAECLNPAGNQPLAVMQASVAGKAVEEGGSDDGGRIDMDLFQIGRGAARRGPQRERASHVFGQVVTNRGLKSPDDEVGTELADPRDRHVIGSPVIRRYETRLKFPLLDSFPRIFPQAAEQVDAGFETRLSSNTTIRPRLKTLRSEVTRLVGIEERENLSSGLADLAEAYREDWSSGSDDDDDDL